MSVATEVSRILADRDMIRDKLISLGLAESTATLDACAEAIKTMVVHNAISVDVLEGDSYTIPAGYHDGSGVVNALTDEAGDHERYKKQSKTVTPTKLQQIVTPDEGHYALSSVIVAPIPEAYQNVSSTTAAAGDVIAGKVFVMKDGTVTTGTMANNGAVTKTLDANTIKYTIVAGYHSGTGTVSISLEEKSVTPTKGTQTITPTSGKVLSKVTVNPIPNKYQDVSEVNCSAHDVLKGSTFVDVDGTVVEGTIPNNEIVTATLDVTKTSFEIPYGYISEGEVSINLETKTETPTKSKKTVKPSSGKVLSEVTINPIPDAYQDITGVTAIPETVLEGSVFIDSEGNEVEGGITSYEAISTRLDTTKTSVAMPCGYYDGDGDVRIELEEKSATPTKSAFAVTPTAGKVLSKVTVNAIPAAYQDVTGVTAAAADVLTGKKIVSSSGAVVNGSMANNGAIAATIDGLTSMSATVPVGYHNGSGKVTLTNDIENALKAI